MEAFKDTLPIVCNGFKSLSSLREYGELILYIFTVTVCKAASSLRPCGHNIMFNQHINLIMQYPMTHFRGGSRVEGKRGDDDKEGHTNKERRNKTPTF